MKLPFIILISVCFGSQGESITVNNDTETVLVSDSPDAESAKLSETDIIGVTTEVVLEEGDGEVEFIGATTDGVLTEVDDKADIYAEDLWPDSHFFESPSNSDYNEYDYDYVPWVSHGPRYFLPPTEDPLESWLKEWENCQDQQKMKKYLQNLIEETDAKLESNGCEIIPDSTKKPLLEPLVLDENLIEVEPESKKECTEYVELNFQRSPEDERLDDKNYTYCDLPGHHNFITPAMTSPDWKGPGWYRFANNSVMPEKPPGSGSCGASAGGWSTGKHPETQGTTQIVTVCFQWLEQECWRSRQAMITRCDGFYVYYLDNVPECDARYCAVPDK
eukprot:TRINITY_DN76_c2_g1_i1.p1 TRINITY_DN76_c2_g1~~TRINITY_DN76_c2_g1_i1.p1  ORF type:complete len:333 (+),score=60.65 TRINITY_DN76_c2_g1_i1:38-1036(+)